MTSAVLVPVPGRVSWSSGLTLTLVLGAAICLVSHQHQVTAVSGPESTPPRPSRPVAGCVYACGKACSRSLASHLACRSRCAHGGGQYPTRLCLPAPAATRTDSADKLTRPNSHVMTQQESQDGATTTQQKSPTVPSAKAQRRPPVFKYFRLRGSGGGADAGVGRRVKRSGLVLCLGLCEQCITVYGSRNYNGNHCARACVLSNGRSLDPDCENPAFYSVW